MSQIACKLSPEPKARVTNMRSEAFFIFSHGAYTIFLPGEAENTTFAIGRWEQKWHFRPARQKKKILARSFVQMNLSLLYMYSIQFKYKICLFILHVFSIIYNFISIYKNYVFFLIFEILYQPPLIISRHKSTMLRY